MSTTYSEENLQALDREVGNLFAQFGGHPSGRDESQERIERILRRARLEARIQGEVDAASGEASDVEEKEPPSETEDPNSKDNDSIDLEDEEKNSTD